jgi:hypothetical protein
VRAGRQLLARGTFYRRVSSSAAVPEEARLLGEEVDVFRWRVEQFRVLGFNDADACELAASEADLGRARYLLGSGCPPPLALQILS